MSDPRLTPANGRVAHVSLKGLVPADRYVEGVAMRVVAPLADLLVAPAAARDRQMLMGDRLLVLDGREGFAFVQSAKDGHCGYVAEAALGPDLAPTHWVSAPATHLYPEPNLKRREIAALTLGARLTISGDEGRFARTADGQFVPRVHLSPIGTWHSDPAGVAESLLGTPYLWGGNSRQGIDCSGLVQAVLLACGIPCPSDSDLQEEALGKPLTAGTAFRRGDLLFWDGHVAMAMDDTRMIHANARAMAVSLEGIAETIARVDAQGDGPLRVVRRL